MSDGSEQAKCGRRGFDAPTLDPACPRGSVPTAGFQLSAACIRTRFCKGRVTMVVQR